MEFHSARQVSPDILENVSYDIAVLASGYEQRCIYLPAHYNIKAEIKIALAFKENSKELHRMENDVFLIQHGYRLITISGEHYHDLEPYFLTLLKNNSKKHLYMLVDYSSMTKVWYSNFINFLLSDAKWHDFITIHFSYTPAVYNEPKKFSPVNINNLVSYPCKKGVGSVKPTALIIGLGLDKNCAEYIRKKIQPAVTYLIYPDPSNDVKNVEKILENNRELIEQIEVRNLISFPLFNLEKTDSILTDLCLNLRVKYNIVIAPVGSKVFSLLALLMASRYPDIEVMRISSGTDTSVFDRMPYGEPLVYSVDFVSDELDA